MAQKSAVVRVDGKVVKFQRNAGTFDDQVTGRPVTYDYIEARVLNDEYDTIDVRFPADGTIPVPTPDQRVSLVCEVRPSAGNVKITVQRVDYGTYSDHASSRSTSKVA